MSGRGGLDIQGMAAQKQSSGGPAPFLVKTHQMVEDTGTDEVISWNEEGSSFVVWKPVEFARDLLPTHFKHNNFSSFVRQLNTYGFRKVVPDRWEFANDHFRRGEQRLLSEIRRRKSSGAHHMASAAPAGRLAGHPPNSRDEEQSSTSTSTPSRVAPHDHMLTELSNENQKLRKDNQTLSSELARARRHCEELLGFLSKYVDLDTLDPNLLRATASPDARATGRQEIEADGVERREEDTGSGGGGEAGEGKESCLRLFGVWLKKRGRCEEGSDGVALSAKKMMMGFGSPWREAISSSLVQGASRV